AGQDILCLANLGQQVFDKAVVHIDADQAMLLGQSARDIPKYEIIGQTTRRNCIKCRGASAIFVLRWQHFLLHVPAEQRPVKERGQVILFINVGRHVELSQLKSDLNNAWESGDRSGHQVVERYRVDPHDVGDEPILNGEEGE